MRQIDYYRSYVGNRRLAFRSGEISNVVYARGHLTLLTVYGSRYHVTSLYPEETKPDSERQDDQLHHYFRWTPPSSTVQLALAPNDQNGQSFGT